MTIVKRVTHRYDDDLEMFLMFMRDDEFIYWLDTNEIIYDNPNLLEVVIASHKLDNESRV